MNAESSPASEHSILDPRALASQVAAAQAELAMAASQLRAMAVRLGGCRVRLLAEFPSQEDFNERVWASPRALAVAVTAGFDSLLAEGFAGLIADLEAMASATAAEPEPLPRPAQQVLLELLGPDDSLVACLCGFQPSFEKGPPMPNATDLLPPQTLKSERIQSPGSWEFSAGETSASAQFSFSSRKEALDFIALATELAEEQRHLVEVCLAGGTTVRVTVEPREGGRFVSSDFDTLAAFNRLVGEDTAR